MESLVSPLPKITPKTKDQERKDRQRSEAERNTAALIHLAETETALLNGAIRTNIRPLTAKRQPHPPLQIQKALEMAPTNNSQNLTESQTLGTMTSRKHLPDSGRGKKVYEKASISQNLVNRRITSARIPPNNPAISSARES